jgi:hypothetical protein
MTSAHFGGALQRLRIASFSDERGALIPFEFTELPFRPIRCFLVAAPHGARRGGHAHLRGRQLLVRVSGDIEVCAEFERERVSLRLDENNNAVLIAAPVWSEQTYLTDARLLVFCDTPYDPDAYVYKP